MTKHITPANDLDVSILQETIKILLQKECIGIKTTLGAEGQTVITEIQTGRRFLVELHEIL